MAAPAPLHADRGHGWLHPELARRHPHSNSTSGRLTDGRSNSTPNFHLIDGHDRAEIIDREAERYLKYGRLTAELVTEACDRFPIDGYVVNEALIIPDIGALAVPVFKDGALVCAVSLTNTISHLHPDAREGIADTLRRAATDAGFQAEAA